MTTTPNRIETEITNARDAYRDAQDRTQQHLRDLMFAMWRADEQRDENGNRLCSRNQIIKMAGANQQPGSNILQLGDLYRDIWEHIDNIDHVGVWVGQSTRSLDVFMEPFGDDDQGYRPDDYDARLNTWRAFYSWLRTRDGITITEITTNRDYPSYRVTLAPKSK